MVLHVVLGSSDEFGFAPHELAAKDNEWMDGVAVTLRADVFILIVSGGVVSNSAAYSGKFLNV